MKNIGIITAMQEEVDLIIQHYELGLIHSQGILKIYSGTFEGKTLFLIFSGIGKIQSTFATTYLLENYNIDFLINIGIAGNISKSSIHIGDVVLPSRCIQHDIYLPFPGEHLNYAKSEIAISSQITVKKSYDFSVHNDLLCLTGDQFIDDEAIISDLKDTYKGDVVEMEAYSILSIAKNYNLIENTVVIKGISDGADNSAIDAHMSNLEIAMKHSILVLNDILIQLK